MKNKPFYFKLREDIQSELEALSQSSGHSCAELSEHAIMEFVYWNSWKAGVIKKGLADANADLLISDESVRLWIATVGSEKKVDPPEPDCERTSAQGVVWTEAAMADLVEIAMNFGKQVSYAAARKTLDKFGCAAETVQELPQLGTVSVVCDDVRELVMPQLPCWLPYRVGSNHVEILRAFLHPKQVWRGEGA